MRYTSDYVVEVEKRQHEKELRLRNRAQFFERRMMVALTQRSNYIGPSHQLGIYTGVCYGRSWSRGP